MPLDWGWSDSQRRQKDRRANEERTPKPKFRLRLGVEGQLLDPRPFCTRIDPGCDVKWARKVASETLQYPRHYVKIVDTRSSVGALDDIADSVFLSALLVEGQLQP